MTDTAIKDWGSAKYAQLLDKARAERFDGCAALPMEVLLRMEEGTCARLDDLREMALAEIEGLKRLHSQRRLLGKRKVKAVQVGSLTELQEPDPKPCPAVGSSTAAGQTAISSMQLEPQGAAQGRSQLGYGPASLSAISQSRGPIRQEGHTLMARQRGGRLDVSGRVVKAIDKPAERVRPSALDKVLGAEDDRRALQRTHFRAWIMKLNDPETPYGAEDDRLSIDKTQEVVLNSYFAAHGVPEQQRARPRVIKSGSVPELRGTSSRHNYMPVVEDGQSPSTFSSQKDVRTARKLPLPPKYASVQYTRPSAPSMPFDARRMPSVPQQLHYAPSLPINLQCSSSSVGRLPHANHAAPMLPGYVPPQVGGRSLSVVPAPYSYGAARESAGPPLYCDGVHPVGSAVMMQESYSASGRQQPPAGVGQQNRFASDAAIMATAASLARPRHDKAFQNPALKPVPGDLYSAAYP